MSLRPKTAVYAIDDEPAVPLSFHDLTPIEQSAASLGVSPSELKPIEFLNRSHFEELLRQGRIDSTLAKNIKVKARPCFMRKHLLCHF